MGTVTKQKVTKRKYPRSSGEALYTWRRSVGLNRPTFARLANFSERSLASYEKRAQLPKTVQPKLNEGVRLVEALLDLIPANELAAWLHTPNSGFGGKRPWTLIEQGERDIIWAMIHQTRQGAFS
ncbi:MAG: antitoxin Xre/MbcA/ParS toxin-binding domain-containing protein [Chthoniobacteraceae bacterium]